MSSKKIIEHFGKISRAHDRLVDLTQCYVAHKVGVDYTEQEKTILRDLERMQYDAAEKFKAIWSRKIGDAVILEIRAGEWDS